ncbi:MAG: circadian clock KaiB family protein [Haliea sp.]
MMTELGASTRRLMLFLADDSPGSRRARSNLAGVLRDFDLDDSAVTIVNVLSEPATALDMSVFATPALIYGADKAETSLYGDLSDRESLRRFLEGIFGAREQRS